MSGHKISEKVWKVSKEGEMEPKRRDSNRQNRRGRHRVQLDVGTTIFMGGKGSIDTGTTILNEKGHMDIGTSIVKRENT